MTAGTATRPHDVELPLRERAGRLARSPVFYGFVVAAVAALAGEWGHVSPPAAYGLCSACHGRDLADWIVNHVEGKHLFITAAGAGAWPLLTVVGVVIGSLAASRRNREFSTVDLGGGWRQLGLGAIVMGTALFVGGCPTRILIRAGFGDAAGLVALAGVAGGIVLGTFTLRWWARR